MNPPKPNGLTQIEALRAKSIAEKQDRARREASADAVDELWTVVAAYKPDSTVLLLKQGRMSDDWYEAFESQHTDAHMHLEPTTLLGTLSDVRASAAKQFQGKNPTDLTIRVVLKKKES